ncbi:MAG: DUF4369 domain-containing protein [Prevotella sp.]
MKNKSFASCMTIAIITIMLSACNNKKFNVGGTITDAADSTLYFENISLDGPVVIDSIKLDSDGNFNFSEKAPEAPEFYRLRIAGQIINLSIDSTETVKIKASYPDMTTNYTVEGSEECATIKELALKQIDLYAKATAINNSPYLTISQAADSISGIVEAYKDDIKRNYIFKSPMRASSYYALFQTLGNTLIFNPKENEDDIKVFAAVATSWDVYHPEAVRGKNLHNIALEGMRNVRIIRNKMASRQIEASKISVSDLIDIRLIDNKGQTRALSDLKGKVVMLDFHLFGTKESAARIMKMRDLYNKYHDSGFEIYQIALNDNEHFWKTQTEALPWISVRDPQGAGSANLVSYNVGNIPTFFLINRNNAISKRDIQIKDLDKEIQTLLK